MNIRSISSARALPLPVLAAVFSLALIDAPLVAQTPTAPATRAQQADALLRLQRMRCVMLASGNITEPLGRIQFQRCMSKPPQQAMKENLHEQLSRPAKNPFSNLVKSSPTPLITPMGTSAVSATPSHPSVCAPGYVRRESDHVCVVAN